MATDARSSPIRDLAEANSFVFGTGVFDTGCQRETYFDEVQTFDMPFPNGPVICKFIRINVKDSTYGDAVDVDTNTMWSNPWHRSVTLQEVRVFCDANTVPQTVIVGP